MSSACLALLSVPAVAAGAAVLAVATPILIHLLSRQRVVVVEWAAMRFLLSAEKSSRRRVDRWVLLAARVLALAVPLMALVAATPWAESVWQRVAPGALEAVSTAPRTHRVLILDTSLSMTARGAEQTRFDVALAAAERAVAEASPGDGFTLITSGSPAQVVVAGPAADPEKVLAELRTIRVTHAAGDLPTALAQAADAVNRSPRIFLRRRVIILTDLQRSEWPGLLPKLDSEAVPEVWQRLSGKADVAVVDVSETDRDNVAVTDLSLADPLALVDRPTAVTVTVQNFGRTDVRPAQLELLLARPGSGDAPGVLVPIEQRVLELLPAGERVTVTFVLDGPARFREPGLHVVQVRLTPTDDLPVDDTRTLTVDVRSALPAVLVNGKPAVDPLKRGTEYLKEALAPGGVVSAGNPVRPRVLSLAEFADPQLGDLTEVDCVFLCDVPTLTPAQLARLESLLKRGGGVVIGLGPTAAANTEWYNRVLFAEGAGLLPGPLGEVRQAAGGYRLFGEDSSFRQPPLAAFRADNARGGLALVPVGKYLSLDAPAAGRARRILSFTPSETAAIAEVGPTDPAVVEYPRFRGKVLVVTTSLNRDWTEWPVLPTYLPFMQELTRHAAGGADQRTVRVGDGLEEFLPVSQVGLSARLTGPGGLSRDVPVLAGDNAGIVRFTDTQLAGVYRVAVDGRPRGVFAVNVPDTTPGGGSESDLRRLTPADLAPLGDSITLTTDPRDTAETNSETTVTVSPRPRGPTLARWALALALIVIAVELLLAWRAGRTLGLAAGPPPRGQWVLTLLALVPLTLALALLATRWHADLTGDLLGFAPGAQNYLERWVGVPPAAAGEGTRWRLETTPAFLKSPVADARLVLGLFLLGVGLTILLYRLERRAAGGTRAVLLPAILRFTALALACFVMVPQLRLAVDREGWPDVAILLDTSASMATLDDPQDPAVRDKMQELAGRIGGSATDRHALARALLTSGTPDLLDRLLSTRQVKIHLYAMAEQPRLLAEISGPDDLAAARTALGNTAPTGEASRLGDAVEAVLKTFRGGSLAAIIGVTDGIVTSGDDWSRAGREAAQAGVPLFLVGLGDSREPLDLALGDVRADDTVLRGDTLIVEARVAGRGVPSTGARVPVVLSERVGDKLIERSREVLTLDPAGRPTPVRLTVEPQEVGEKTFVIEAQPLPGEVETGNNRVERVVSVTESKTLRVLYLDGYPRYEFRFLKAFLEREALEAGQRSVELRTVLVDASPGYAEQDKSALRGLPTRAELFEYDVVILGDVDPEALPQAAALFQDISEFVTQKGGGLLVIAGVQASPRQYFGTPLATVLPVAPTETTVPVETPLTDGYRPVLSAYGKSHPLFRLAADEVDNARAWATLEPLFWSAGGYRRKQSAEVLATHPDRPGEAVGEPHPLVVQQFAGAGRVLFFGFDESWRWRYRQAEDRYNQFWIQAIRVLAKSRVSRPELRTDRQTAYRRGEPIRLTVRFPDDAPPPADDAAIKVRVERFTPNVATPAESYAVQLAKVAGTRATYETLLTRTPDGDYRFELTDPPPVATPNTPTPARARTEARVLPPPGERDRLDMDRAGLERAAGESRGRFYTLATAETLIDDLPEGTRVPLNQPVPPVPVWNHAAIFALFAGLLSAEWLLRRRGRLV